MSGSTQSAMHASNELQVLLFGAPHIVYQGKVITANLSKRAQALFYFLITEQKAYERTYLASLIWSDMSEAQAKKNLRNILPELRTWFDNYLQIDAQYIGPETSERFWCDLVAFQKLLTEYGSYRDLPQMNQAVQLYTGEFLEGFQVSNAPLFEEWMLAKRQQLRQAVCNHLFALGESCLAKQAIHSGLENIRHLLTIDPLNEAAHRLQVRLLLQDRQPSAALAQLASLKQALSEELGVEPDAETLALGAQIRDNIAKENASVMTDEKQRELFIDSETSAVQLKNNLPGQLTSFIGREHEINEIRSLLFDDNNRLLTLTGLGGIGKTRLAMAVAQSLLSPHQEQRLSADSLASVPRNHFADGIYFISLIGISADDAVKRNMAITIMDALQLERSAQEDPMERLFDLLNDKSMLLILDNYEHLLAGNDFPIDLLRHAPKLKLLVTSRQLLDLQAETVYPLQGLSLSSVEPQSMEAQPTAELSESEQLFRQRMPHSAQSSALDPTQAEAIRQICQAVDGLPLAIELVAATTRLFSCWEVLQKLNQGLDTIQANFYDLPARHRSLTALIDTSYQLLSKTQQQTLASCSIFPESFTLQAGSAVANVTSDLLFSLADASLLRPTDAGRFEMHPLVRQYARTKLQSDPALEHEAFSLHVAYYANLVEPTTHELLRSSIKFHLIGREIVNLCIAWRFATEQRLFSLLRKMAEGIFLHFLFHGPISEGIAICDLTLEKLSTIGQDNWSQTEAIMQSIVFAGRSMYWMFSANDDELNPLREQALQLSEKLGDFRSISILHFVSAFYAFRHNNLELQEHYHRLGIEAGQKGDAPYLVVVHMAIWGSGLMTIGQISAAISAAKEGLHIVQQQGYEMLYGYILTELSLIYLMAGELTLADESFAQARHANQAVGAKLNVGYWYERVAVYAETLGDYEQAHNWANLAVNHGALTNNLDSQLLAILARGRIYTRMGDYQAALADLTQAIEISTKLHLYDILAIAHIEMGNALIFRSELLKAIEHYRSAVAQIGNNHYQLAAAHAGLACALHLQNLHESSSDSIETAFNLLFSHPLEMQYDVAGVILRLFKILRDQNDPRHISLLRHGYDHLLAQSEKINDEQLRRSFLENVPAHRFMQTLASEHGLVKSASSA